MVERPWALTRDTTVNTNLYSLSMTKINILSAPTGCPSDLSATPSRTTAKLSWKAVPIEKRNGFITGYTVEVRGPNLDSKDIYEVAAFEKGYGSIEISNLTPFTSYTFKVSAKTNAGVGPAAQEYTFKTLDEGKSHILSCLMLWIIYRFFDKFGTKMIIGVSDQLSDGSILGQL